MLENHASFQGGGGTTSANTFSGTITTSVVEVLPNGHLVVAGEKQIGVNHNVDVLRFTGTVDPLLAAAGQRHQLAAGGQCACGVAQPRPAGWQPSQLAG